MAKKSLYNLVVGDKSFIKDRIYTDEQTENCDQSNFVNVDDSALESAINDSVSDSTVEESVEPLFDSQPEDEKKSDGGVDSFETAPEGTEPHTLTQEDIDNDKTNAFVDNEVGDVINVPEKSNFENGI